MKIKDITLQNYKKFVSSKQISFSDNDGEINEMTLIVGDNGTGKSSVLQAIVAMIAPLTRSNFAASHIEWNGFEYRFIQSGRLPLKIQATISFSQSEIDTTRKFATKLEAKGFNPGEPGNDNVIDLKFGYQKERAITKNMPCLYQFMGHQYAKQLSSYLPNSNKLFENVGNIYWYTEQRNSYDITHLFEKKAVEIKKPLDDIRMFLSSAYSFHIAVNEGKRSLKEGEYDFYETIARLYHTVFPDREFVGSTPRFDLYEKAEAPDFFLTDGTNQYELSEMSAGERAIFPILMDFARYHINNSIIIIDEVDLHLHGHLQRALISALPKLGHNNQFILTSHSDNVAAMFNPDENQIIRLQ